MHRLYLLLVLVVISSFSVGVVAAQSSNTCPAIVNDALSEVSTVCANLGDNSACYGYDHVVANFIDPQIVPADSFDQPGDIIGNDNLHSIETSPVDVSESTWGVGLMRIRANLPNALSEQSVLLLAAGGQQIENGVREGEELVLPAEPTSLVTSAQAELRPTYPAATTVDPVAVVPANASVSADGITPDGQWVRIVYQNRPGWIPRSALATDADLSGLVEIASDDYTRFQSLYLVANVGPLECQQAPAVVVAQGPENIPVDIVAYETPIRIESTIVLWTDGQQLMLATLYGLAVLYPDTPDQIIVPAGFMTSVRLAPEDVSLGTEGDADERAIAGGWAAPRPLTPNILGMLDFLNDLPGNLLNYPITLPRIVQASGVGGPRPRLIFADPRALEAVRRACEAGRIPEDTCQMLLG